MSYENEKVVDIMIVIDVLTILQCNNQGVFKNGLSQDSNQPTQLYSYYMPNSSTRVSDQVVCMYTTRNYVSGGSNSEGTAELSVDLNQDDYVHWRTTTLTKDMKYAAILYQYTQTNPDPATDRNVYLDQITANVSQNTPMPIINNSNPPGSYCEQPFQQKVTTYYWSAHAAKACSNLRYNWSFMIVDPNNKILGYCAWDPYFVIS